jgi:hypothetical protein
MGEPRGRARWPVVVWAAAALAGCGNVRNGSDVRGSGGTGGAGGGGGGGGSGGAQVDAPADGDAGVDAADSGSDRQNADTAVDTGPPPACDLSKPFGTPTSLDDLNSPASDSSLAFSTDGLTAYVSSGRTGTVGGFDIFAFTRSSLGQSFANPMPLTNVNTADDERSPRPTGDGLRLFYFTNHASAGAYDIAVATRATVLTAFGAGAPLAVVNSDAGEVDPFLTKDEAHLYFASDRTGGLGGYDIYLSDFTPSGALNTPRLVAELSSTGNDGNPVLSDDGLTIYFSSDRNGNGDIWVARRASVSDGFGAPTAVAELNSPSLDFPILLSTDGCMLYLGSSRTAGTGGRTGYDLFQATRPR